MIQSHRVSGRSTPKLVCDVCQEDIVDAGLGAAVYPRTSDAGYVDVWTVHKENCLDAAEARLGGASGLPWQELTLFLVRLLHNVGIRDRQLADILRGVDDLNALD